MKWWGTNIPYGIKIFQIEYFGRKTYDFGGVMLVNIPYGILIFPLEYFWSVENPDINVVMLSVAG